MSRAGRWTIVGGIIAATIIVAIWPREAAPDPSTGRRDALSSSPQRAAPGVPETSAPGVPVGAPCLSDDPSSTGTTGSGH